MKKLGLAVACAAAFLVVSGPAMAGQVYLYGLSAKGKSVKAGKYSRSTRVFRADNAAKMKASTRKRYAGRVTYCGKEYMVSKVQQRWIAAHSKAKHQIVVRENVSKGKWKTLCKGGAA